MPRFKVALHRRLRDSYGPEPNPFLAPLPGPGKTSTMSIREWELEAQNEAEVRRLLDEARELDVAAVRGYSLRSIERLPEPQDDDPKCDRCGAPVTTGMMAVFCPRAEKCEFWPDDESSQALLREFRRQHEERIAQQTPLENYIGSLGLPDQPNDNSQERT